MRLYCPGTSITFPIGISEGGTGLTALGDPDEMLGVNDAGTALIYKENFFVEDAGIIRSGTGINYNSWVTIDNPDATNTYKALVLKHGDGLGNHQHILQILDQTGITEYVLVDQLGQSEFQNITMRNLFGETTLYIQDISSGAGVNFGTSFTAPAVPSDGFTFFANPFGGNPTWVNSASEYLGFLLTGAGADEANTTYLAVSDQGNAGAAIYYLVGQYNFQPVLAKRLGQSLTAVSTTATQNALGDGIQGGANITATVTTINGITAPENLVSAGRSGSRYIIRNKSTNIITINHLSGSAAGADQIRTPNGLPFYLMPEQACELHYDTATTDWRFIADVSDDGVWTPTLTNTANVAASTAYECRFMTHGKRVFCSGRVDIDPTTTLTLTQLRMSLPIASNLGAKNDAGGVFNTEGLVAETGVIFADAASDTVEFNWTCVDVTNKTRWFNFSYERI